MSIVKLTANEIAEHQLLASIKLWHQADYLSALTLAGAAEEILGKRLRSINKIPSLDQWKNAIVLLARSEGETDPKIDKLVANLMNDTRNLLKHYAGDESVEIDIKIDCIEMIERAIANYHQLTGLILSEAIAFWADVSDTQADRSPLI